ncbi:MAG: anaerobic glycerol-3-phosphate dehydrogenase subunit GlpB [Candidatus Eremiobacterota bacterium]
MMYNTVIIGAGLAGCSAALSVIKSGKKPVILSRGLGNLYSSSGYIDLLGYYPVTEKKPVMSPVLSLEKLMTEKPYHPYSITGIDMIKEAFSYFLSISSDMGLPYCGSLEKNMLMPTAAGSLVPTTLFPKTADRDLNSFQKIVVTGIKELIDFFPSYCASNMEVYLGRKVDFLRVDLGLKMDRELNSYDIALFMEQENIRDMFIKQLKSLSPATLILIPAVMGVTKWKEIITSIEQNLQSRVLEIPTLPPSVMGYRLGEALLSYLKHKGVEIIIGNGVDYFKGDKYIEEVGITGASGRVKKFRGKNFILATGGILGEGLSVCPGEIKETVFNLPVLSHSPLSTEDFFNPDGQPLSYAGVQANGNLQPLDSSGKIIFENLFVAGATLYGYDPFLEKSGNGVALSTGYKAGLMACR